MTQYAPWLQWIDTQHEAMCRLVTEWAQIGSGSSHLAGLVRMREAIRPMLGELAEARVVDLPPRHSVDERGDVREIDSAAALHATRRGTQANIRIFLGIHFDTVYDQDHPFQSVRKIDDNTLIGPGVCDAKGGLIVLLTALRAVQRSPFGERIEWEVLLNPDEEIGSPGSASLLAECAQRNQVGLLFEPALPDGGLVSQRKGSSSYVVVVRGKSAHVGRDYAAGRNAIHALAQFVVEAAAIPEALPGVVLSVGNIQGGGPTNVVPDLAICRLNLRAKSVESQAEARRLIEGLVEKIARLDGIRATLHLSSDCPPKVLDEPTRALLKAASDCGEELGIGKISSGHSGGVSDGNRLAAAGLPNLDTLGVRGGKIHSDEEFVRLDSLTERAKLAALLMMKLAEGSIHIGKQNP